MAAVGALVRSWALCLIASSMWIATSVETGKKGPGQRWRWLQQWPWARYCVQGSRGMGNKTGGENQYTGSDVEVDRIQFFLTLRIVYIPACEASTSKTSTPHKYESQCAAQRDVGMSRKRPGLLWLVAATTAAGTMPYLRIDLRWSPQ